VREVLGSAELVAASDLTLVECDRVLIRAVATGEIDEAAAADRRALLNAAASHWHLWRVSSDIVERARHPFPAEPVRMLDAIHLASVVGRALGCPGRRTSESRRPHSPSREQLGFHLRPERVNPARV
jgi:hypothetical protein